MKNFIAVLLVIFILLFSAIFVLKEYAEKKLSVLTEKQVMVCIEKGAATANIIRDMNKHGLMEPPVLFEYYLKYLRKTENKFLQAGCHEIPAGISQIELIEGLSSGKFIAQKSITFPEGLSYKEICTVAAQKTGIPREEFIALCESPGYREARGIRAGSIEGYLLPETYSFNFRVSAEEILNRLINEGMNFWSEEKEAAAAALGMTKHEVLTLASIVEAETPVADEYRRVAGVYHNRLRIGMALQADPTVQYALGSKARLLREDMDIKHPYNTYVYPGLPPGPINNPGKGAIEATLNPEEHDLLYFVAVGDGSGRHNFSKNFEGHQANIRIYRQNRRANR